MIVPPKVVRQLITRRGSLPDRAIRTSIKACQGDETPFLPLQTGLLVVEEQEFSCWRKAEYSKGKWPSQRSRLKHGVGRRTKQTTSLRNTVLALVRDGLWSGKQAIAKLQRLLIKAGREDVPSADTLARLVDKLHDEIGHAGLRRAKRVRRKRSK